MKEDTLMKKVLALVLVLMMVLSCSALAADQLGFLPPAMTSPFYASCIEGATPVAEALGYVKTFRWRSMTTPCNLLSPILSRDL